MTTPSRKARHPSAEGNFALRRYIPVPLHWRGGRTPGPARRVAWVARAGWLEISRKHTYYLNLSFPPYPPHKHIRVCWDPGRGNDRGESARAITKQNAHRTLWGRGCRAKHDGGWGRAFKNTRLLPIVIASKAWRSSKSKKYCGQMPADIIYTLNSTLFTLLLSRTA